LGNRGGIGMELRWNEAECHFLPGLVSKIGGSGNPRAGKKTSNPDQARLRIGIPEAEISALIEGIV
jgi:hypothetical protein